MRKAVGAAIVVGLGCVTALFLPDIRSAIDVWNASTAYSHCYLVLPMMLYLLWDRRHEFEGSVAQPDLRWAFGALPIAVVWFIAERLGIMEARQLAVIAGADLLLLSVLGWRLVSRIAGPLLFLFFLVPFGAFLTPVLQRFTAWFTVAGLDVLGIANFSNDFVIETASGTFFVAEACAGLRFLIAAVAFGTFYALLTFRSWGRRLCFIAASVVVPIVANGFRALGIVVLGQVLGSAEAAAADHIIYGWLFFSAVMLLLIAVGQCFREDGPAMRSSPAADVAPASRTAALPAAACVVFLLALGPIASTALGMGSVAPASRIADPLTLPAGCSRASSGQPAGSHWTMAIDCGGTRFSAELRLFPTRSTSSPLLRERREVTGEIGAENAATIPAPSGAEGGSWTVIQTTDPNRVTAVASWVDGRPNAGGLHARFVQARDSLLGADHSPVLLTISASEPERTSSSARQATLGRLLALVRAQAGLDGRIQALSQVRPSS